MQDSERAQEAKCGLCGEPMPEGEEMFKFHGYSGGCPKPPLAEVAKYLGSMLAVDTPPSGASPQSVPCHCGGVMFGDGHAHAKECPCFEGASPQATGGYIHHSLTDWIPTPECDCDRCTSARKSAPKPTGGASPQAETSEQAMRLRDELATRILCVPFRGADVKPSGPYLLLDDVLRVMERPDLGKALDTCQLAPVSPVEPEPPTRKRPTTLELSGTMPDIDHGRNCRCAECQPTVEPEPCVWRAIATVPKDGTRILLTPAVWTAGRVVSAYYRLGMWWIESADARGSIRAFTDPDEDASHWPFTHWTPLPGAPLKVEREP